jgi:hypothetical protein
VEATTAPVADPNNAPPRRLPLAAKLQYAYLVRVPIRERKVHGRSHGRAEIERILPMQSATPLWLRERGA